MKRLQKVRKTDYITSIRDKIDVGQAVNIINATLKGNKTINGKPIKKQQEWMAWKVIDKMLPSLQAVSIDATVNHVQTMQDVNAQLLLAGINPQDAWKLLDREQQPAIEHDIYEEKQTLAPSDEAPHTPDPQAL